MYTSIMHGQTERTPGVLIKSLTNLELGWQPVSPVILLSLLPTALGLEEHVQTHWLFKKCGGWDSNSDLPGCTISALYKRLSLLYHKGKNLNLQ